MNKLKINDINELEIAKFILFYNQKRLPENCNMFLKPTNQFQLSNKICHKQKLLKRVMSNTAAL